MHSHDGCRQRAKNYIENLRGDRMLKAVIFDMDGVIIDSEPIHFEIDKRILRMCGINADDEMLLPYVGVTNPYMWNDLKQKYELPMSVDELMKLQSDIKIQVFSKSGLEAIDGIKELLADLKHHNIISAVASSSPRFFIETVLKSTNIREFFSDILSGEEVERGKPFPDIFLKTAEMLGVSPEECIVIEDSEHGVKAALAAGMKCIGFTNPNSGSQDLSRASSIVSSISELNYEYLRNIIG
jgi:HAD superfamily hydrolase (TIGR01509 family)